MLKRPVERLFKLGQRFARRTAKAGEWSRWIFLVVNQACREATVEVAQIKTGNRCIGFRVFSVQPLCSLCLCGLLVFEVETHHRDTEVAQRRAQSNSCGAGNAASTNVRSSALPILPIEITAYGDPVWPPVPHKFEARAAELSNCSCFCPLDQLLLQRVGKSGCWKRTGACQPRVVRA